MEQQDKKIITAKQRKINKNSLANLKPFKPGQSGNPNGPPPAKTQLYRYFCQYMEMTKAQIDKLDYSKLTMAQLSALTLVEKVKRGEWPQQKEVIERDEGKVPQKTELSGELGAVINLIDKPMTKDEHRKRMDAQAMAIHKEQEAGSSV